jgi:hypothetical protein
MSNVIPLRYASWGRLVDEVNEESPVEVVLVYFTSDHQFKVCTTGIESRTKVLGALDLIKYEMMST